MFSYWEQESFTQYDHIVIGAGLIGLSTAIELRSIYPTDSILVVERGLMSTGASSRNAGFACMGSVTELLDDLGYMAEQEVLQLFAMRKEGLTILRNRLGDKNIGYAENGSYELLSENELYALDKVDFLNQLLYPINNCDTFSIGNELIPVFKFSKEHTKGLIKNLCEGELHTGMMLKSLTDLAIENKIEIKTGCLVTSFLDNEKDVTVSIQDAYRNDVWQLRCKTLNICTNAFTTSLLPNEDVTPGRGQVLITHPIEHLPFKGIFHFDMGYYYFRVINNRILFGGGRNLDFKGETTTDLKLNETIQHTLIDKLKTIILPEHNFSIDMQWSGIMAFGKSKFPIIKKCSNNVYGAFRMGGMGVALGSKAAQMLKELHQHQ